MKLSGFGPMKGDVEGSDVDIMDVSGLQRYVVCTHSVKVFRIGWKQWKDTDTLQLPREHDHIILI